MLQCLAALRLGMRRELPKNLQVLQTDGLVRFGPVPNVEDTWTLGAGTGSLLNLSRAALTKRLASM